jgi:small subunit ribosomal protein S17
MVHDPENQCHVGDQVRIVESRPISKTKKWLLLDILSKAGQTSEEIESGEAVRA